MKNILFLVLLFNLNLFGNNLKDIFDKKITMLDGIYDLGAIAEIIENNLGIETVVVFNKNFNLVTKDFKEKKLEALISGLLRAGVEIKFLLKGENIILQLSSPLKSLEEPVFLENKNNIMDLSFKNSDLKTITESLKNMIGVEFVFQKKEKEKLKIDCNLNAITIDEFLSFLKKNYKIKYEKEGDKIYIK